MIPAGRRRAPLIGAVGVLLVAALGLTGWALRADDGGDRTAQVVDQPVPSTTAPPARATTAAPGPALPQPEAAPADPYADTPDVVYGTLSLPPIGMSSSCTKA